MVSTKHQNLANVIEYELRGSELHIVYESVPGGSIREIVQSFGRLEENLIRAYIFQTLIAVSHLHSQGITHGNLTIANIMLDMKGMVLVSDCGCLSSFFLKHASRVPGADPNKMSLQRCAGEFIETSDPNKLRTNDMFGFGTLIYEMVTTEYVHEENWDFQNFVETVKHDPYLLPDRSPKWESASDELLNFLQFLYLGEEQMLTIDDMLGHPFLQMDVSQSDSSFALSRNMSIKMAGLKERSLDQISQPENMRRMVRMKSQEL